MSQTLSQKNRLVSLDLFRGFTIVAMVLVNNPGSWSQVYAPLLHAEWNGCTPTDLIFPFFILAVGMSIALSLGKAKKTTPFIRLFVKILKRSLILIGLGIFLNGFPYFDWEVIRIPGVLQRIGIVFFFTSLIYLSTNSTARLAITIFLLLGYWALMTQVPVPGVGSANLEPTTNLGAWLDNKILGGHLWGVTKVWDPEGLLSTLPAIASGLIGVQIGEIITARKLKSIKLRHLIIYGLSLLALGIVWNFFFPINKNLWTSSYVLYTAGWGCFFLAILFFLFDLKRMKAPRPILAFGINAITLYIVSSLLATLFYTILIGQVSIQDWIFKAFSSVIPNLQFASFLYALVFFGSDVPANWIYVQKRNYS